MGRSSARASSQVARSAAALPGAAWATRRDSEPPRVSRRLWCALWGSTGWLVCGGIVVSSLSVWSCGGGSFGVCAGAVQLEFDGVAFGPGHLGIWPEVHVAVAVGSELGIGLLQLGPVHFECEVDRHFFVQSDVHPSRRPNEVERVRHAVNLERGGCQRAALRA